MLHSSVQQVPIIWDYIIKYTIASHLKCGNVHTVRMFVVFTIDVINSAITKWP